MFSAFNSGKSGLQVGDLKIKSYPIKFIKLYSPNEKLMQRAVILSSISLSISSILLLSNTVT